MGVSMLLLLPLLLLLLVSRLVACGFVLMGGAGRAKGLGGPWAPALRRVLVEGEGGGRTTCEGGPCCCGRPPVAVCAWEVLAASESAVPASSPEASLGICTFRRGRFASDWVVLARAGGPTMGALGVLAVR